MAKLIAYGQLTTDNSLAENFVKAQCEFCGKKFGSLEESRKCESKHIMEMIGKTLKFSLDTTPNL